MISKYGVNNVGHLQTGAGRIHRALRDVLGVIALSTCCAFSIPEGAFAQSVDTLRIVVPFSPGSVTDLTARLLGEHLQGNYASTVIVENKTGASGRIGIREVKAAPPDGSTVFTTPNSAMAIFPHVYKNLGYDPIKDFAPVAMLTTTQIALLIGPAVPDSVKTVNEFVEWVKSHPEKNAFYSTAAAGSAAHFTGVMLANAAGVDFSPVHFKGTAPAMAAMLGGEVPLTMTQAGNAVTYLEAGTARVLAITGTKRSPFLPDVPTMIESGYPDVVVESWNGIFAPANTSPETLAALSNAIAEVMKSPDVLSTIETFGAEVASPLSLEELKVKVRQDVENWGSIVEASGFKVEDQ